ncbi:quinolinate synthetase complex subunit A [Candidatus Magnetoovum chiemensis]|nr:quinolinate synthetase complex subunit A [Candidatus Magnetoovum chiemensis]KJR41374.1 quinolinate synthetase complex subunit A [Candidatus Magnetoovum chiemensis]
MSDNKTNQLLKEVLQIKQELGKSVVIPAHHYEMDDIVKIADFLGDSYKLAVDCAATEAEYIVFCGVMFMAEGASLLAKPHQTVLIPDKSAGCPMAEMIDAVQAEKVYNEISSLCNRQIIPIVYMNSYADMKAFCGERGGTVCTSSNAAKIVKYFLDQGKSIFFAPDYNLGINTSNQLKLDKNEIVAIKQDLSFDKTNVKNAKMFVWDGFCHVHKIFTVDDIKSFRQTYSQSKGNITTINEKNINVIVHPECSEAVVNASDYSGSTSMIWKTVKAGTAGSIWAVGTELRFVERMANEFKDKTVVPLRKSVCYNMSKITLEKLKNTLTAILNNKTAESSLDIITVAEEYKENAKKALKLMIEIVESGK